MKRIVFSEQARADIRAIPRQTAMQILIAIHRLAETGAGRVKTLKGQGGEKRLRIGDFRVRFTEESGETKEGCQAGETRARSASTPSVTGKRLTADGLRSQEDRTLRRQTRLWRPLGYTKFEYANLTLNPTEVSTRGSVEVSADISNVGDHFGEEVVQLYINDTISSVTRPVRERKGFQKVGLKPGEKKTVRFTLTPEQLAFYDQNVQRLIEPGTFQVMVGSSSQQIHLRGNFEVR